MREDGARWMRSRLGGYNEAMGHGTRFQLAFNAKPLSHHPATNGSTADIL